MTIRWSRAYNRLFELINQEGRAYFSGPRFLAKIREVDPYFPDYYKYLDECRARGKSTSRKDYFYDILMQFPEENRLRIVEVILDEVRDQFPDKVAEIRAELDGVAAVPLARVVSDAWNAARLNEYLADIDTRIGAGKYEGAVTIAYTCLEGFLKAFVKRNVAHDTGAGELVELSKAVRAHLRDRIAQYPDEALNMLNHIAHTVDRARNRFSEAHFDERAGRWLAVFIRDLVNAEIRLLLHFM